jgi:hypothetical protein
MTPQEQALHEEIASLTLRVARPLIWHDRTEGWPKLLHGGTCFFLRFERGIIGVTANHVISGLQKRCCDKSKYSLPAAKFSGVRSCGSDHR